MGGRYLKLAKRTAKIFSENDTAVYAGHATLSIVTAVFPLIMLIISLLNMLPWYSPEDFTNLVFRFLPDVPQVKALFLTVVTSLRAQSTGLLASVAALTALWSASAGVTAVQTGLKRLAPGAEKSLWDKPLALLCTVIVVVLIPGFLVFNVFGDTLVGLLHSFSAAFGFQEITSHIATLIRCSGAVTAAAAALLILGIYTFLPGGKRKIKDQIPGAVFTALCWFAFTEFFTRFVTLFWKSSVYGSLASLFLTFTWLRVMILILFFGEALNAAIAEEANQASAEQEANQAYAERERDQAVLKNGEPGPAASAAAGSGKEAGNAGRRE